MAVSLPRLIYVVGYFRKIMQTPNKTECFYILAMLESNLIDFSYVQPWADKLISESEEPASWLCDMAVKRHQRDQVITIREFVFSEPFESEPVDLEKFHVACLWLRYERRELSWATFLGEVGEYLDAVNGDWNCEIPFHYLNLYEDLYFSSEAEESTKKQYLREHDLKPWIELAKSKFQAFCELERLKKINDSA